MMVLCMYVGEGGVLRACLFCTGTLYWSGGISIVEVKKFDVLSNHRSYYHKKMEKEKSLINEYQLSYY